MAKKSPKKNKNKSTKKTNQQQQKKTVKKPPVKEKVASKKEVKIGPDFFEQILKGKAVFLAAGVLLLLLLITFGSFLFGDRLFLFKDIGSDTINVFYPQLYHIADYLATEGIPKWSFNQGMGQNLYPLSLNDPFNLILYIMGPDNLAYGIAWIEMLKLFVGGMFFFSFLRMLNMGNLSSIVGAILYSFSGFMLVGAGWYVFSTQGVYLALYLWGFERLFQKKSGWMLGLSVFLIAFNLPVDLYLMSFFLLFYSALRTYEEHGADLKKFGQVYLSLILWGTIGFLMSMGMLIAMIDQIANSPRVSGESAFFDSLMAKGVGLTEGTEGLTIIGRLFANDFFYGAAYDTNTGQLNYKGWYNYLEAPALYCGLSTLLLLPQAFVHYTRRQKIVGAIGLGLLILPLFVPFFRNALWLFSGDYYRIYSLFVSLGFMFLGLRALDLIYKKKQVNLWLLGISFIFWIFLMFAPFLSAKGVEVDGSMRNILVILMIAAAAAIGAMQWPQYRASARIALLVIVSLEALYIGSSTYSTNRLVITKTEFQQNIGYKDYTVDAVNKLKQQDPGFYRVEKIGYRSGVAMHGSTNDAKAQDYFASASYHSFNQKNYIRFLSKLNVIDPKDENQTRWAPGVNTRPLLQEISSTKYILTKGNGQKFWFTDYDSIGDVKILQNPYFLPIGFTYDQLLNEATFDQLSTTNQSVKKQIALLKAITVEDSDLGAFQGLAKFDTSKINPNYLIQELEADVNARRAEALQLDSWSQNHFKGSIKVSKPKALFLSIPYEKNWTAKIDGKEVPIYRANAGFMAIPLAAGEHSVELRFSPPYFTTSWIISLIGFILFGGLIWWTSRKKNPTAKEEENDMRYDGPEEEV